MYRTRKNKKGKQRKQKKDDGIITRYILESIDFHQHSVTGYGPMKTESCETTCIIDQSANTGTGKKQMSLTKGQGSQSEQNDFYFFAIYDGHGINGKDASFSASDYIQNFLESKAKQIKKMNTHKKINNLLKNAFKTTEKKLKGSGIDYNASGTCCVSVLIKGQNGYIANLGDSRAVLYRQQKLIKQQNKYQNVAIELSWDHKPTRPDEKDRIRKKGGKIERLLNEKKQPVGPYRVWEDEEGPGIAITRTLGDFAAKCVGLISDPEIQRIELTKQDQFIVAASDGVWNVMSSGEVVGFVIDQLQEKKILNKAPPHNNVAEQLVKICRARWDQKNKKKYNQLQAQKQAKKEEDKKKETSKIQQYGVCDDITAIIGILKFREETIDLRKTKGKQSKIDLKKSKR